MNKLEVYELIRKDKTLALVINHFGDYSILQTLKELPVKDVIDWIAETDAYSSGGEVKMEMHRDGDKIKYSGSYGDIKFEGEGEFEKEMSTDGAGIFSKIESEFEATGNMDKESLMAIRAELIKQLAEQGIELKDKGGRAGEELSDIAWDIGIKNKWIVNDKWINEASKQKAFNVAKLELYHFSKGGKTGGWFDDMNWIITGK